MPVSSTSAPAPAMPIASPGRTPVVVTVAPGPSAIAAGPERNVDREVAEPPFCAMASDRLVGPASASASPPRPNAAAAAPPTLVAEQDAPAPLSMTALDAPGAGHTVLGIALAGAAPRTPAAAPPRTNASAGPVIRRCLKPDTSFSLCNGSSGTALPNPVTLSNSSSRLPLAMQKRFVLGGITRCLNLFAVVGLSGRASAGPA